MFQVYKITCTENGKIYIGITTKDISIRWKQHVWIAHDENSDEYNDIFKKAIRKYGVDAFVVEVIDQTDSIEKLKELEQYYIKKYNSFAFDKNSNGYNSTRGGDGVFGYNTRGLSFYQVDPFLLVEQYDSVRQAEQKYGQLIRSKCWKDDYSVQNGLMCAYTDNVCDLSHEEIMHFLYRKNNVLVQCDMTNTPVKYWLNAQTAADEFGFSKQNITACLHGRRISHGGYRWYFYRDYEYFQKNGFPEKRYTTKSKEIIQYTLDAQEMQRFSSLYDAAQQTGFNQNDIAKCCLGITGVAFGYIWRYGTEPVADEEKATAAKRAAEEIQQQVDLVQRKELHKAKKHGLRFDNKRQTAVLQYTIDGDYVNTFYSVREIQRELHLTHKLITAVCRHEIDSHGGYIWRYITDPLTSADIEQLKQHAL